MKAFSFLILLFAFCFFSCEEQTFEAPNGINDLWIPNLIFVFSEDNNIFYPKSRSVNPVVR